MVHIPMYKFSGPQGGKEIVSTTGKKKKGDVIVCTHSQVTVFHLIMPILLMLAVPVRHTFSSTVSVKECPNY